MGWRMRWILNGAQLAGKAQERVLGGVEYLVVPVTMLREGVFAGSEGPIFYPGDELEAAAAAWNGMPLVVNHPRNLSGQLISARQPAVQAQHLGMVLNAHYTTGSGGTTTAGGSLAAEAWFIKAKLDEADARLKAALLAGTVLEVSTGLNVANMEAKPGTYGGSSYTYAARGHLPDHLAILLDEPGACSTAAGCGLGVANTAGPPAAVLVANSQAVAVANATGKSFEVIRDMVRAALDNSTQGTPMQDRAYVEAVYPKSFVFYFNEKFWEQLYTIEGDYASLVGNPEEVIRKVTFSKPVTIGNAQMDRAALLAALSAGGTYGTTDADKAWLEGLTDDRLSQLAKATTPAPAPVANAAGCGCGTKPAAPAAPATTTPAPAPAAPAAAAPVANAAAAPGPQTLEAWLATAPPEVRPLMQDALSAQARERSTLSTAIIGNSANVFTQAQLDAMPLDQLRGVAAFAATPAAVAPATQVANYFGSAGYHPAPVANAGGTAGGHKAPANPLRAPSTLG